jgi:hypothetical protein
MSTFLRALGLTIACAGAMVVLGISFRDVLRILRKEKRDAELRVRRWPFATPPSREMVEDDIINRWPTLDEVNARRGHEPGEGGDDGTVQG